MQQTALLRLLRQESAGRGVAGATRALLLPLQQKQQQASSRSPLHLSPPLA
jgi:hypothetical protein